MGRYSFPNPISLSDSGPPPNANFHPTGKHQSLQGHGSPQNRVLGYTGDEYLDLDTGDKWNKMGPTDEPRRATVDGWEPEGVELADIRDFGVDPDSDDEQTDLIQEALAATANEGFILSIPDGTYRHGQLTLAGAVKVRGTGRGKVIFKSIISLDSTSGLWNVSTGADVVFEDVWLHGNDAVNRVVRVNESADVEFRHAGVSNAYGSVNVSATVSGILVGGGGTFKFLNSRVADCIAEPDGDATGNVQGTVRGIHIAQLSTEAVPSEVLISGSSFENILSGDAANERNEDADAIAYQSFGQDTKGNVKIIGCHFNNIGKRWLKALSPGGMIVNCDGVNTSPSTRGMFAIFSINTSDWQVHGNRCTTGACGYFCDVGNTAWACNNVSVKGNQYLQGSDPNLLGRGVKVYGASGFLTTGVVVEGNIIGNLAIGVLVAGGVVGCTINGNYVQSTDTAYYIGPVDAPDLLYPSSLYVEVGGNIFNSAGKGVYFRKAANSKVGINSGIAATPFQSDEAYATQFDDTPAYRMSIIGGSHNDASSILAGHATPGTFGAHTPKLQSVATSGISSAYVETRDGTRNTRAMIFVNDTGAASTWGLDSTFSSGGNKTFFIRHAAVDWLSIDGTKIINHLSIIPNSGNTFDLGSAVADFRSAYLRTSLLVGKASSFTGVFTLANASSANTISFSCPSAPVSAITYIWPADDPAPGDALRVTSFAAGVATLEWSP